MTLNLSNTQPPPVDLGILVYVDHQPHALEEFGWLYKSLLFSGLFERARLIAVCHPQVAHALQHPGVRVIPSEPYAHTHAEWAGYGYINSVANLCAPQVLEACQDTAYLLKTDCDTFVTQALRTFRPSGLCFGLGGYAYEEDVRRTLSAYSARYGFAHSGLHNVGASVLGPTAMVSQFLQTQMTFCTRLLQDAFADGPGTWPGWCKAVLTMYAGELALRATYPQQCSLGLLDHFPSGARTLASDVLHIHAWHTADYWSKHDYRAGKYAHMPREAIDPGTLGGYCHYLACASVDEIAAQAATRHARHPTQAPAGAPEINPLEL